MTPGPAIFVEFLIVFFISLIRENRTMRDFLNTALNQTCFVNKYHMLREQYHISTGVNANSSIYVCQRTQSSIHILNLTRCRQIRNLRMIPD